MKGNPVRALSVSKSNTADTSVIAESDDVFTVLDAVADAGMTRDMLGLEDAYSFLVVDDRGDSYPIDCPNDLESVFFAIVLSDL